MTPAEDGLFLISWTALNILDYEHWLTKLEKNKFDKFVMLLGTPFVIFLWWVYVRNNNGFSSPAFWVYAANVILEKLWIHYYSSRILSAACSATCLTAAVLVAVYGQDWPLFVFTLLEAVWYGTHIIRSTQA